MMRIFFIILLFVFLSAFNAAAQTKLVQTAFENGVTKARAGEFETALKDFQNALDEQQNSKGASDEFLAKINYNIGICFYRLGNSQNAVNFLNEAVRLSKSKYRNAFYALAMAQVELENWRAAKDDFCTAIRLQNGRDGESWFDLAFVYLRERDYKNAADAFQNAIRYKSVDRATAHNNLGVLLAFDGDWGVAEKEFKTALVVSGGTLREATRNLEICRSQHINQNLIAKLEFTKIKNRGNQNGD